MLRGTMLSLRLLQRRAATASPTAGQQTLPNLCKRVAPSYSSLSLGGVTMPLARRGLSSISAISPEAQAAAAQLPAQFSGSAVEHRLLSTPWNATFRPTEEQGPWKTVEFRKKGYCPAIIQDGGKPFICIWLNTKEINTVRYKGGWARRLYPVNYEGKTILVYVRQYTAHMGDGDIGHMHLIKWHEGPEAKPLKVNVPIRFFNTDKSARIKMGGYVHNYHQRYGLQLMVTKPNFPTWFDLDFAKAEEDDFFLDMLELPEGSYVEVPPTQLNKNGRLLLARAKRVRG